MVFFLDYLFFRVFRLPPTALLLPAAAASATTFAYSSPFGVFTRLRISTTLVTCSATTVFL